MIPWPPICKPHASLCGCGKMGVVTCEATGAKMDIRTTRQVITIGPPEVWIPHKGHSLTSSCVCITLRGNTHVIIVLSHSRK
jgi:hypothetical protein